MKNPMAFFCVRIFLPLLSLFVLWACNRSSPEKTFIKDASDLVFASQLKNRGSYDSAIIIYSKATNENLKGNNYDEWSKSISGLIDCYRAKGDLDEAMRVTESALAISYSKLDTTGNLYNGFIHKKANLFSDKRQFEKAAVLYSRNIRTYKVKSSVPDTGLALSYNGMGTLNLLQNKYDDALKDYQLALDAYEKASHTNSSDYASTLQNIGIVHSLTGNYEQAEQFFLKSLKVKQGILKPDDPQLASLYLNMGRFYQIVRNDSKAIEYMSSAENFYINQNQSNSITAGSLFLNMGVVYIYTADYEKAQSYLDKSLEIITSKAPGNISDLLIIYLNMGYIAEMKGNYTLAKDYYIKGMSIGSKLPTSAKVLRRLANVSFKLGDKHGADVHYQQALKGCIEMFGEEHIETALTYLRYGDFLGVTGNPHAKEYLDKSLELYQKSFGPVNIDVSSAYYYIGNYYFILKNYNTALSYFQHSLIAGYPGFTSENISDNPEIITENPNNNQLNPMTAKATSLFRLYQIDTTRIDLLKNSASSFSLALHMLEMVRSTYQDEDSKLFLSGNEKRTFSNALLAHVKLFEKTNHSDAFEEAFKISEKGKSSILLSHLRDKEAKNIGNIPEELQKQDATIKSEIFFYNKKVHDEILLSNPDQVKIKLWNSKLFDLKRKQEELIKTIEKDFPKYFNLKYDNSVITSAEIQERLKPNQVIVDYYLSDSILFTFVISKTEKTLLSTTLDSSFNSNIEKLRQQLTGKAFNNYTREDYIAFVNTSSELYKMLLMPVSSLTKGKELIIVPDGELGYLSFDVLLTSFPDTAKTDYRNLPYLIRESAVSYAPSATTFFDRYSQGKPKNNGQILAYGPDYSESNKVLVQKNENGKLLSSILTNLDNSQEEIKNLSNYFKVKSYLGSKATEKSFKQHAPDYRVLHLAMHTVINNENPLYSKLIFYQPEGDTTEDGMLNASELINMELHADMAVLSACNTGSGQMRKGEGIMSLSRDFFYAGIPGIVMTSWAVEDRSGVKLMNYFYKYIAEGKARNEALKLAKTDYLSNSDKLTSHPHYWAAYMNVGDISPIDGFAKKTNPFSLLGAIATLLCIALLLVLWLRKKPGPKTTAS